MIAGIEAIYTGPEPPGSIQGFRAVKVQGLRQQGSHVGDPILSKVLSSRDPSLINILAQRTLTSKT